MYRIRTLEHKPIIISEYGENKVETLHVKVRRGPLALTARTSLAPAAADPRRPLVQNLLSLGEDRYLTTVILKHFAQYKLKFTRFAKAQTIAPDDWKVLMSQRRRWINSTIHNLFELLFIDRICGFCCFSMRFVILVGASQSCPSSFADEPNLTSCPRRPRLDAHLTRHRRLHRLRASLLPCVSLSREEER